MKKFKKLTYFILILLIIISLGFTIYKVIAKGDNNDLKAKTVSEIEYVEQNLVSLFNLLNNINYENYTIIAKVIDENESTQSSDSNNSSGGSNKSNNEQESGKSSSNGNSESSDNKATQGEKNEEYELKRQGILTNQNDQIDWNTIKNQVESMYTYLTNMTLDLYQINIPQKDILNFNVQYDKLTKVIKDEDKNKTMKELVLLYEYIPGFIDGLGEEENKKIIAKTKNNIFKAYSLLDENNWKEISNNINLAIEEITPLLTKVSEEENKQYSINKCYILINELNTAINLQDREIFLIKYKNLLEELENI